MAPRSAVEQSEHRPLIDKLLKEGKSSRFISKHLSNLKKNPETISHTAINTYKKKKFNVAKEATIQYNEKKSKELLNEAVTETVSDIEYCDNIIKLANEVDLKVSDEKKITELDIKKLGLQAIKTKQEIFKQGSEDEKEFKIIIEAVDSDENDTLETQQETSQ